MLASATTSDTLCHCCGEAWHSHNTASTPMDQCCRVAEGFWSFVVHHWKLPLWLSTVTCSVSALLSGSWLVLWCMISIIYDFEICSAGRLISEQWKYCIVSCHESYTASNSTLKLLFISPVQMKLMHFEEVKEQWTITKCRWKQLVLICLTPFPNV